MWVIFSLFLYICFYVCIFLTNKIHDSHILVSISTLKSPFKQERQHILAEIAVSLQRMIWHA